MKLAKAHIRGFRSIRDLEVEFDALTAIVGSGGVGKSACLRAIDWCVNERDLDPDDVHRGGEETPEVAVALTFTDLTNYDREVLGRYATGEPTTFTRTWSPGAKPKLSGSALFYEPFDAIRELQGVQRRKAYQDLFDKEGEELGLPSPRPTRVDEVDRDMQQFEREHPELCKFRPDDASHLFGFTGGPKLRDCFDYVLVDATAEAPDAFGPGRDSALSRLLASIGELDDETQARVEKCQADAQQRLEELIGDARRDALKEIATGINERVRDYVPDARVELTEELAPIRPPEPRPVVRVQDGSGYATDIGRQGHGLQRALVIAVLQALADSAAHATDGSDGQSHRRSLMLAIEEPELYQHPLQARALAEALQQLAIEPDGDSPRSVQIAYSTHSAYFVRPTLFESLRLFRRASGGETVGAAADSAAVTAALTEAGVTGELEGKVRSTLAASLREAVFARAVLLCEGRTDAALVEALARRDRSFERDGIAAAPCWGKTVIPIAVAILNQLEIPTFVFFDADRGLDDRLATKENLTDADRKAQVADVARKNEQLLQLSGEAPTPWPAREVRKRCANLEDTLESDIAEIWPELLAAKANVARALGMSPKSEEAYRQAVDEAGEPPKFFIDLLAAIRGLDRPGPK